MLDTQDAARRLYRCRRLRGGILDCRCARRSANQQVGTKGWSCPIEQRDANFDLSSAGPPPMTDLLNLAHTTYSYFRRAMEPCGAWRVRPRSCELTGAVCRAGTWRPPWTPDVHKGVSAARASRA